MELSIENFTLAYNSNNILENVNVTASCGEMVALIGRNGTGKSSFLRSILSLQPFSSGKICVDGNDLSKTSFEKRSLIFSYVSTMAVDIAYLTVWDIVSMGRTMSSKWSGELSKDDKEIVEESLRLTKMESFAKRNITSLSDGERQRVMIARAIAQSTPIIILDEPTAFLDVPNRILVNSLLHNLSKEKGKLIIFSTHEIELAHSFADTFWFINGKNIISSPASEFVIPEDFKIDKIKY